MALSYGEEGSQVETGSYCLPAPVSNMCPSRVYYADKEVTTTSGVTGLYCHINTALTTCGAVRDATQSKECAAGDAGGFSQECGLDGLDDGICSQKDVLNTSCSVLCFNDNECAPGEKCAPIVVGSEAGKSTCVRN